MSLVGGLTPWTFRRIDIVINYGPLRRFMRFWTDISSITYSQLYNKHRICFFYIYYWRNIIYKYVIGERWPTRFSRVEAKIPYNNHFTWPFISLCVHCDNIPELLSMKPTGIERVWTFLTRANEDGFRNTYQISGWSLLIVSTGRRSTSPQDEIIRHNYSSFFSMRPSFGKVWYLRRNPSITPTFFKLLQKT